MKLVVSTRDVRRYKQAIACDPCAYCGAISMVLDHIVSRAHGGPSTPDNYTAACWRCNSGKAGRSVLSWLAYELFIRDELIAARNTGVGFDEARELAHRWMRLGEPCPSS